MIRQTDELTRPILPLNRRNMLRGALSIGVATQLGQAGRALAQSQTPIDVLGPTAMFVPDLLEIINREADVNLISAPFQSSVDAVARLTAPGGQQFDLIISSYDFAVPVVMGPHAGDEKTQPITVAEVPNIANVNAVSQYALTPRDGKYYIVPICWGYDTVLYNPQHVPSDDPYSQSWGLLFEDKYAGRLAWWDSALNMLLAAGLYLGHTAPDTMDRSDLNEVGKYLISKKKNVRTIFTSNAEATNLLATGEIVACYGPVTIRVDLEHKKLPVAGAFCKEGVLSLIQSGYIPKRSSKPELARKVINTLLDKTYAGALARGCGYLSTSKFGAQDFTPEERKRYGFGMFDGTLKYYPQKFPKIMNDWISVWARVKSA